MFGLDLVFGSLVVNSFLGLFALLLLYWYSTRNHDYWEKKNVPHVKPLPLLGSILDNLRRPFHEVEYERQLQLGPVYGYYEGNNANISVGDPALLRDILVKDFAVFPNRRPMEFGDEVINNGVAVKRGEDWKRVRSIITPTFSTGKIKRMLSIVNDCAETLVNNFKTLAKEGKSIDVKRIYGAFSMDVIASSAFSTKLDSHNDPDNKFVQVAKNVFNQKPGLKFLLFFLCPWLVKLLKLKVFAGEAAQFFKEITLRIIEERKRTGQVRNDFLQLLMDIVDETEAEKHNSDVAEKEKEDIMSNYEENDAGHHIFKTATSKKLSTDDLVAQCVIFFIAGYDTTATSLAMATYFLALNQDVQDKLRAEVDSALEESNGELTYEAMQSMKYLDNVISETLRIYPISVRIERYSEEDYKLGDTGITIPKGMIVSIPVIAVHRDPKHWPNPEKFDPDRFTPERKAQRDPYSYLPFGAGPRNCLGMRFALMEVKVCLAHVVANFKINRCPQTKRGLLFLALIPSLMAAEVLCPNGKTTCPEELYCCEVDGEHACCDPYATTTTIPETKMKIYPGVESKEMEPATSTFTNASMSAADAPLHYPYEQCSIMNCPGPCCSTYQCCREQFGRCCSADKCCGSFQSCCSTGCCGALEVCCNSRCCPMGAKCCGTWCCDKNQGCGRRAHTCTGKGIALSSDIVTVLVLALGLLMSRHL